MSERKDVGWLISEAGGEVKEFGPTLPDGSSYAVASFPLPQDHWIYGGKRCVPPPMPFRMGTDDTRRKGWQEKIRAAAQYAIRAATLNGKDMDFDPDALVQNLVVGMLGYHTPDGLSSDSWANPTCAEQKRNKATQVTQVTQEKKGGGGR